MAPDVAEMKQLAVAFKLASAFTSMDKLAYEWIERGQRNIDPKALDLDDKNAWLDLRDKWESTRENFIKKINRFKEATGKSPILRYERQIDRMGVHGKIYLGFDSPQAKGYRIVQLDYPIWFEETRLPTENYSEERVLSLVPAAQRLTNEQYNLLFSDFLDDLRDARIPGVYEKREDVLYAGPKQAEYKRRFDAAIDRRRTYNENIIRVDRLVEQLKREHALIVAPSRGLATGPPVSPFRMAVPITNVKPTVEEEKEAEKLEQEAAEEVELQPEPDQTVYVKLLIQGGVHSDEKGKPKIERPEFFLMCTTPEEFAKHGNNWNDETMWSRPLMDVFGVAPLIDVLKEAEIDYDAIEDNAISWGDDWDAIREALAENPPPFNKYAVFHIKWLPQDITWTESATQAYDIYNHKYTAEELNRFSKRELQVIAKIKELDTFGEEADLIARIAGTVPAAEEKAEVKEAPRCEGGAHILSGAYEKFNLPRPSFEEQFKRPIVALYKCIDQKTKHVVSEYYFCDICAAELETNSYPGGPIFPSMYPVRQYDNVVCRRIWLPGGEEKVKALIARVTKPIEESYLILGKRAIEMANKAEEAFSKREAILVDWKDFLQHWDVVPPESKLKLKNRLSNMLMVDDSQRTYDWLLANPDLWAVAVKLLGTEPKPKVEEIKQIPIFEPRTWEEFRKISNDLHAQGYSVHGRLAGKTPQEAIVVSERVLGKYKEHVAVKVPMGPPIREYIYMDTTYEGVPMGGLWIAFHRTSIKEAAIPKKSAADVLAEEALNELASEALDELGEL